MASNSHKGFIFTTEIGIPNMRRRLIFSYPFVPVLLKSSFHFVPVLHVEVRHNDLPRLLACGPEACVEEVGRRISLRPRVYRLHTGHPWSGSLAYAIFIDQHGGLC